MTRTEPAAQPAAQPAATPAAAPARAATGEDALRELAHDIAGSLCALQGYSHLLRRELAPGSDEADLLDCIDEAVARLRASSDRLAAVAAAAATAADPPQR